jgi:hypothetical protein
MRSLPEPAQIRSLPPATRMRSFPRPPRMTSRRRVPTRLSGPALPTIVAPRPAQLAGGGPNASEAIDAYRDLSTPLALEDVDAAGNWS